MEIKKQPRVLQGPLGTPLPRRTLTSTLLPPAHLPLPPTGSSECILATGPTVGSWLSTVLLATEGASEIRLFVGRQTSPKRPMGIYLGRLCPLPRPRVRGGHHGAHFAHQLVPQQHLVVPTPPGCPNYLRIWRAWPVVAFLRLCVRIPRALCLFLGVLTSFCRRCHQRACGQRTVMPQQDEHPRVLEKAAHQERGPEDRCHQQP